MTSEQENDNLSDLNIVAAAEFKQLLAINTDLLPEWKTTITKLFENGIPEDLKALQIFITGEGNVKIETTQG